MKYVKTKQFMLMLALMFSVTWNGSAITTANDGPSLIIIKESSVQGTPKVYV